MGPGKVQKSHSLDIPDDSPILRGMKRCLFLAAVAAIIASLTSCGVVSRTMGSVGRTFSGSSGQSAPVVR